MARPRAPLAARFGAGLLRRLDQALGGEEEPINPCTPYALLSAEQGFAEPVFRDEDLLGVIGQLTGRLCATLEKRGEGARRMCASFFAVDGKVFRLEIGTSRPLRDAAQINRLFADKFALSQWECEFGFDRIRVGVTQCESREPAQVDLATCQDGPQCAHLPDCAHLIDRLSVRLGEHRVLRFIVQDTHVPEQACVPIPAGCVKEFGFPVPRKERGNGQDTFALPRPLRLFERPEPIEAIAEVPDSPPVQFRWRRLAHEVARVEGPERIAMPWWRDPAGDTSKGDAILTRDYFRIETSAGVRLWLFREGLYSETKNPRWFLHGFLP
jgi:protein ImuB